jgi:hypothetical protein
MLFIVINANVVLMKTMISGNFWAGRRAIEIAFTDNEKKGLIRVD